MAEYGIVVVDAFTTRAFAGNPCAVVTEAEGLDDQQMQTIAREMNLSETAYVTPSAQADFRVRFFTPIAEIPLAGHPTIATMHALVEQGRIALSDGRRRVTQQLRDGVLPVDIERTVEGVRVTMTQRPPEFGPIADSAMVAQALGIEVEDLLPGYPCQVVSTGTKQLMVPVVSRAVLEKMRPVLSVLDGVEQSVSAFGTHIFALDPFESANRTHARHFSGAGGFGEDPVTGSATGGMAAYLWKTGLLREPAWVAEQGDLIGRPGRVGVEIEGDGPTPKVVRVAGTAVTILRGTIEVA